MNQQKRCLRKEGKINQGRDKVFNWSVKFILRVLFRLSDLNDLLVV